MNKFLAMLPFVIGTTAMSFTVNADEYVLDSDASSINFATIKKAYTVEPANLTNVEGKLDDDGAFSITSPLNSISTGIPIRDERLNALFFNAQSFPTLSVAGTFPMDEVEKSGRQMQVSLPVKVTLHGKTVDVNFDVNVLKLGETLVAYTYKPTIISGSSFGIPTENLNKLAETVGSIPLSDTVPVNVSLVFNKK